MSHHQRPVKLCFLPYFGAASHTFSLLDIARYFSFHGQQVTIITTPSNAAQRIQKVLNNDTTPSDHQIRVHIIPLSLKETGLSEDFNELNQPQDFQEAAKLDLAIHMIRGPIQEFLEADSTDCIISDAVFRWCADLAAQLGVPCISFNSLSVFTCCVNEALKNPESPHHEIESNDQHFMVPGLPVPITLTKAELPGREYSIFMKRMREGESKSYATLFNSFLELDYDNSEYYSKVTGSKVIIIGPASEILRKISGRVARCYNTSKANEHECLSWLNSKNPESVLYVSFGTIVQFPNEQLIEIASALQSSGHEFIWVVRDRDDEEEAHEGQWLPTAFHEKIKGKGVLVKGWAPQLSILDHPSIGGFMTHCGWNSLLEGFSAGVPMITWPSTFDQFYNEKLVVQVAGVGLGVGAQRWTNWFDNGRQTIRRENIENAIRKLMDNSAEMIEMRRKVKEYGKMAKRAVEEDGSSHRTTIEFIEELKILRDVKTKADKN